MPITQKSQHSPERSREYGPSSYYENGEPSEDFVVDTEDELRVRRGENGRFAATENEARIDGSDDRIGRIGQRRAKPALDYAHESGRSTMLTARAHPALAAAMLGGIATAAVAGVTLFRANRKDNSLLNDWRENASPRQTVAKRTSKKSH